MTSKVLFLELRRIERVQQHRREVSWEIHRSESVKMYKSHTHINIYFYTTFIVFQSLSCSLRWISIFRAAVQLVSALCCSGSVGPGPAHLAVRLIMSDMITTELAAVYFHIYPEAANRIWFSAKRRLLIELMRLSCSRSENQKWALFSVVQGTMFSSSSLISLWGFSSKHVQREFFI